MSYSPGTRFVRATVYYRVIRESVKDNLKYFASFICIVPVRMTTDLKYWKVIILKIEIRITFFDYNVMKFKKTLK